MNLEQPITVQLDAIRQRDGKLKNFPSITLSSLDLTIIDDVSKKNCSVRIKPFPTPLVLWSGSDYDNIGDYTQTQVENKVSELLGNDPSVVLKTLVPSCEIIVK
jgi:hypothetical protein